MRSSRSSSGVAIGLAVGLILMPAAASLSAHRTDEFLQAARLAIDPGRVQIDLDLTPGIAVAERVLSDLDGDHDGAISPAEAQSYVGRVLGALSLDADGTPLTLHVTGTTLPAVEAIRRGEGTMRIQLAAAIDRPAAGVHHLRYRNAYRADIGVYLANALVPSSDRIAVTDQQRDVDQRELGIDYVVRPEPARRATPAIAFGGIGALIAIAVVRRRRGRVGPRPHRAAPVRG